MKVNFKWNLMFPALGIFLLTRVIIVFGHEVYISDLNLFKVVADYGVKSGYTAYRDFWFPYPPLALPLIYIPSYFSTEFSAFRRIFQLEMFIFDAVTLCYIIFFLKNRVRTTTKKISMAVLLYSVMGLFMGHLIYDRFDPVIAASFMVSAYYFTGDESRKTASYVGSFLGAIVKLVPMFWLPIFVIFESFETGKINFKRALKPIMIMMAPFFIFMSYYDSSVNHNLFKLMGEQGARGIQIESSWGSPWMLYYSLAKIPPSKKLNSEYAAQHINDSALPEIYLFASRYAGFLLLGVFFLFLAFMLWRGIPGDLADGRKIILSMLFVIVFLISTQRVLSPQYMIWLMPGLAVATFMGRNDIPILIHAAGIFALTWVGFDLGYWQYADLDLKFVMAVNLRNLMMISLCILLLKRIFTASKEAESQANAST